MRQFFITQRFLWCAAAVIPVAALGANGGIFFLIALGMLLLLLAATLADVFATFRSRRPIKAERKLARILSLSDKNRVSIVLRNESNAFWNIEIIDELPVQLQRRNFTLSGTLLPGKHLELYYEVAPTERGEYHWGHTNVFIQSRLGLCRRRLQLGAEQMSQVYPSLIQMRKIELLAEQNPHTQSGGRVIRKLGNSYEFEQIKEYVQGDDIRTVNWRATGRAGKLMVNQYVDERSQQIYCIIDKSRSMRMPFNGLSLLDYAINSTLALSNVILRKYDKAGLISFSDKMGAVIQADARKGQLNRIMEALYNEKERNFEANYELLFQACKRFISVRSLLLLFTNFESYHAFQRVLPLLRKLNQKHLLVLVFFRNTELEDYLKSNTTTVREMYHKTAGEMLLTEKRRILQTLRHHGIETIYTAPENLSTTTLNAYLQLKQKGRL